jgi:hypothetical protein
MGDVSNMVRWKAGDTLIALPERRAMFQEREMHDYTISLDYYYFYRTMGCIIAFHLCRPRLDGQQDCRQCS